MIKILDCSDLAVKAKLNPDREIRIIKVVQCRLSVSQCVSGSLQTRGRP